MGLYLGYAIGTVVSLLLIRYLTSFRLVMGLLVVFGLAVSAFSGFMLAWPIRNVISPFDGDGVGGLFWVIVLLWETIGERKERLRQGMA